MPKSNRIDWDDSATAGQNARSKLPALVEHYFRIGRKVAAPGSPEAALHQFRLTTKRLRYTLEFFRFCYGPGLGKRLAVLREVQSCLGEISDCAVTRELAAGMLRARWAEGQRADRFLRAGRAAKPPSSASTGGKWSMSPARSAAGKTTSPRRAAFRPRRA